MVKNTCKRYLLTNLLHINGVKSLLLMIFSVFIFLFRFLFKYFFTFTSRNLELREYFEIAYGELDSFSLKVDMSFE